MPVSADGTVLDVTDLLPTFSAHFDLLPELRTGPTNVSPPKPLDDPGFMWTAGLSHFKPALAGTTPSSLPNRDFAAFSWWDNTLASYPNADAIAKGAWTPFSVSGRFLSITADHPSAKMRMLLPADAPNDYVSGALMTYPYSQCYGYFEAKIKIPSGRGLWPAFWLLPADGTWPPEIDVMEVLGQEPAALITTIHSNTLTKGDPWDPKSLGKKTEGPDLSLDFHLFGVDWGPSTIRFYLDRLLVYELPTPEDMHQPFYILLNLGVGGPKSWPGAPDASTHFPADMLVDYIGAWQRPSYLQRCK